MEKLIHFNTGRLYSTNGQRITALYDMANEVIHFKDHDRMISGIIPLENTNKDYFNAQFVLRMYDTGKYTTSNNTLKWEG